MTIKYLIPTLVLLAYDPETTQQETTKETTTPVAFTQEKVNQLLAEERRKGDETKTKLIGEITTLKSKTTLSAEELDSLNKRLEETSTKYMTETELLKTENNKLKKTYDEDTKKLSADRDSFATRFTKSTIHRAITDAATVEGAYRPKQVIAMVENNSRVVELNDDDGKPTGEFAVMIKFHTKDEKGKAVTLDLPVDQAIKRLKDDEEYGNLFKGTGTGGMGDSNRGGSGKGPIDINKLSEDPEAFRKARAEGKI